MVASVDCGNYFRASKMLVPVIAYIMVTMAMGCGTNLKTTNYPGAGRKWRGSVSRFMFWWCSLGVGVVGWCSIGVGVVSIIHCAIQYRSRPAVEGICFPVHVLVVLYWCRCGGVVLYWCRGGGQQDWQADRGGQSHNRHTPYNRQGAGGYGGTGGDYTKRR
uniref:Uncharacterized protein n=1 Tax=Timema poppense TaxID=170557 RepID=A0A7R9DK70_TIMPO|nr:unnamed protein product [Timema poppensis]